MTEKTKMILVYTSLIISMIIWAGSFVWSKIALEFYSSFTIVFFRLIISSILLLFFMLATGKLRKIEKKHMPIFMLLSFFEPFLYFTGETTGLNYVSPAVAAIIIAVIPLFTPFAALIFLKEKISVLNLIGIVISMCGIILVIFEKGMKLLVAWEGLTLLFLAVLSAVAYSVVVKKIPEKYSVMSIVLYQNLFAVLYFLPIILFFFPEDITGANFHPEAIWPVLNLGFFASTIAFLLFLFALRNLSITKVNVFANVIPVFALIIAWFILKETVLPNQMIGIFVVIFGVIVSQFRLKSYYMKKG
jgi:drug/metabolite transporter (DMT)-like permease